MRNIFLIFFSVFSFSFYKTESQPIINSILPTSGTPGTIITITGSHFSKDSAANIVYFGAVKAYVLTATTKSLNVIVPFGATLGPVTVTSNNLVAYSPAIFNVVSTANGTAIKRNSFLSVLSLNIDLNPRSVILGDFDQDGKPDLAITKQTSDSISIFRNTSSKDSISFAAPLDFIVHEGPFDIATADFNGDGALDLVVTDFNGGVKSYASMLINNSTIGNISFKNAISFGTGKGTIGVAVGDLNQDGKVDFGVCSGNSSRFSIYQNKSTNGVVSFAAPVIYNYSRTDNMAIGNIDNDGKPELIVSNTVNDNITIYHNYSSDNMIHLEASLEVATARFPSDLSIMDLNLDGKPDIVVDNYVANSISIFKNLKSKSISFADKQDIEVGTGPERIAIADLNGDDKPEIITANETSQSISVLQNESTKDSINFNARIDYLTEYGPTCVIAGDLNGDGKPELIVTNSSSGTISIYKNKIPLQAPIAYNK